MIASPPFVRALRQPVQAVPVRGAKGPLPAVTPLPPGTGKPIRAGRNLPGSALAPKVSVAPRLLGPAAAPAWSVARSAALLSVALHLGLVAGWAVLASPARPLLVPDLETAQVDLVSEAQFSALTAPQPEVVADPAPALAPAASFPADPLPQLDAMVTPDIAPEILAPEPPSPSPLPDKIAAAEPPPPLPDMSAAEPPAPKPQPKAARVADPPKPKAEKPKAEKPKPEKLKPEKLKPKQPAAATVKAPKTKDSGTAGTEPAKSAAPGTTVSKGEAKALKADWGAKLRSRINRKLAVPKGTPPGRAKVRVTVAPSGALLAAELVESSGLPALDAAALKAAKAAAPFPPAPKGLSDASYSFTVPIRQDD